MQVPASKTGCTAEATASPVAAPLKPHLSMTTKHEEDAYSEMSTVHTSGRSDVASKAFRKCVPFFGNVACEAPAA